MTSLRGASIFDGPSQTALCLLAIGWPSMTFLFSLMIAQAAPLPQEALAPLPLTFWEQYGGWLLILCFVALGGAAFWLAARRMRRSSDLFDPIGEALHRLPAALELPDSALADTVVAALRVGLAESYGLEAHRTLDELEADPACTKAIPETQRAALVALWSRADSVRFRPAGMGLDGRESLLRDAMNWLRQCPREESRPAEAAVKDGTFAQQLLTLERKPDAPA